MLLIKYKMATQIVPNTIARGIVFDGFSTDSAGVVAHSNPINPHMVSNVTRLNTVESGNAATVLSITKLPLLKYNNAKAGIIHNGTTFSIVNRNSTRPASATPRKFNSVTAIINAISKGTMTTGDSTPKKGIIYPAIAITT